MPWFQPLGRAPKTSGLMISNAMEFLCGAVDALAPPVQVCQRKHGLGDLSGRDQPALRRGLEQRAERCLWILARLRDHSSDRLLRHFRVDEPRAYRVARDTRSLDLRGDAARQTDHRVLRRGV